MSENKQMLFARNLVNVCVDTTENGDFQGQIWHQYADDPIKFYSVMEMLTTIDGLMDEWDFPQKSLETRSFVKEDSHRHKRIEVADDELVIDRIQKIHGTRNIQNKRGQLATFILQISFRQNATWQGQVLHAESNEKESFSSELELTRIIERALS